jgi:type IV pilus assembly protein PilW
MTTRSARSKHSISSHAKGNQGLSLVELMVALAISMVVLFAVSNVFVATKMNTRLQTGVSRANENAQISSELLAREIRHTAHIGCPQLGDPASGAHRAVRDSLEAGNSSSTFSISQDNAIRVLSASDPDAPASMIVGSAALDVVHGANDGVHLSARMVDRGAVMYLTGNPGVDTASLSGTNSYPAAIISTCAESTEVFEVARVLEAPWRIVPKNNLRVPYTSDSRVMPAARTQFFLAPFTRPDDERSTLAVYRRTMRRDGVNWNAAEAIAHDVQSMSVVLHLDSDSDYQADAQLAFGSPYDPKQVVGLSLNLVFETPKNIKGTHGKVLERPYTSAINIRARVS